MKMTVNDFVNLLYNSGMHGATTIDTCFDVDINQIHENMIMFVFKFDKPIADIIVKKD
jgi:hypothetical protein